MRRVREADALAHGDFSESNPADSLEQEVLPIALEARADRGVRVPVSQEERSTSRAGHEATTITKESNVKAKSGLFAEMTVSDRIFSLKTKTETASLRDPSQDKSTTYNMCAERIVNPQASTLMTVTKEIESPKRKKTDEIV